MAEHEIRIVTKPFEERPCGCVKNHSPRPLRTEEHHPWPQADQLRKYGRLLEPQTVALCDTAHANVHVAINRWLKGQPAHLANRHQRELAHYGYKKIREPGPAPE